MELAKNENCFVSPTEPGQGQLETGFHSSILISSGIQDFTEKAPLPNVFPVEIDPGRARGTMFWGARGAGQDQYGQPFLGFYFRFNENQESP